MQSERFDSFIVTYKETDLWIGLSPGSVNDDLKKFTLATLKYLWDELETYINSNPHFGKSLRPLLIDNRMPKIIKRMILSSQKAGIGPMSSVAGFFSEFIGKSLKSEYMIEEIVVENGGDIYLDIITPITLTVHAGKSPLSEKIGITIPQESTPLGICTSSGTVGPSLSYGIADAVMIACKDTALADSYATAFCNNVRSISDIEKVLQETEEFSEILAALIICDDKMGIRGDFEMVVL